MIKLVFFLKKKPGMSRDAFIHHYENGHAKLGEKHVPNAVRYVRRYLEQLPELFTGDVKDLDHDVITEIWFADHEQYDIAMKHLARADVIAEIVWDEETLFDRSAHRVFLVDEHDSYSNINL